MTMVRSKPLAATANKCEYFRLQSLRTATMTRPTVATNAAVKERNNGGSSGLLKKMGFYSESQTRYVLQNFIGLRPYRGGWML